MGLTASQAKVYLALAQLDVATARAISMHSKLARQEVYRVFTELQQKGLLAKIVASPMRFTLVSPDENLSILVRHQKEENSKLQKKAAKLLKEITEKQTTTALKEEPETTIVQEKGNYFTRAQKLINNSKTSIDVITTMKRYLFLTTFLDKEIVKALKRGVKFRIITEKPNHMTVLPETLKALEQNPLFTIRYSHTVPQPVVWTIDNKEAVIVTSTTPNLDESGSLWTNNSALISILKYYFETKWDLITKFKPKKA